MKWGVVVFPGSCDERDTAYVLGDVLGDDVAMLWHGDADPLVPLQQSQLLVEKLKGVGTDVEFHVKPGGGHPWLTIHEEVKVFADWFDKQLATK